MMESRQFGRSLRASLRLGYRRAAGDGHGFRAVASTVAADAMVCYSASLEPYDIISQIRELVRGIDSEDAVWYPFRGMFASKGRTPRRLPQLDGPETKQPSWSRTTS